MFQTRDVSAPQPRLCTGMFVKAGIRDERFWLQVKSIGADGTVRAIVDSTLIRSAWHRGEKLMLQQEHVLETACKDDRVSFQSLVTALGSQREAALTWHERRVAAGKEGPKGS